MATVGTSMAKKTSSEQSIPGNLFKLLLVLALVTYLIFISFGNHSPNCPASEFFSSFKKITPSETSLPVTNNNYLQEKLSPTNLSHLVFGLVGSVKGWRYTRKAYVESWWRPNVTRGLLYLDEAPTGYLLPWSAASPPYRVSQNITKFVQEIKGCEPAIRIVHGIMEVMRELDHDNLRWLVMGDDDTIFFVDNIVDVLSQYDHTKYYYLGGQSESIVANYIFSFEQGFGGAGFMLSYPLAKALVNDMENCLRRYAPFYNFSDQFTMSCIADLGVNLSPHKGIHQIDLVGDISGYLSSHPKSPLMSLHHFDVANPIFPNLSCIESTRHLMKAAAADQSRMLQQTICYHRQRSWSFSVSWGYSAHIYESILSRSYLRNPIETFKSWLYRPGPLYMLNTRLPSKETCSTAPHVFFFKKVNKSATGILTTYSRAPRGLPLCRSRGNRTVDLISEIHVFSPATKRIEMDRCECCDIVGLSGGTAKLKFRECMVNESIA